MGTITTVGKSSSLDGSKLLAQIINDGDFGVFKLVSTPDRDQSKVGNYYFRHKARSMDMMSMNEPSNQSAFRNQTSDRYIQVPHMEPSL